MAGDQAEPRNAPAAALGVPRFQVGDRVQVVRKRHNPMQHTESYQVGERGVVALAPENSSVVHVQLEGDYEVVDSVLPLHKVKVHGRSIVASVLHLELWKEPQPIIYQRALKGESDVGSSTTGVASQLLDIEKHWLTAIFTQCDTTCDRRLNLKELLSSIQAFADVAAFFGVSRHESAEVLEALFAEIAGKDDFIDWNEFCRFYVQRLSNLATTAGASAREQDDLAPLEADRLREVFGQCEAGADGRARVADVLDAAGRMEGAGVLYGLRCRLRQVALEDVVSTMVDGIGALIGGDDGDITLMEVMRFAEDTAQVGMEMSLAEKMWWDGLFKKASTMGLQVGTNGRATFVAREGEVMSRQQFLALCKESPLSALLFGMKRRMQQKSLEDATRDAVVSLLRSVLSAAPDAEAGDPRVDLETLTSSYLRGVRGVPTAC